MTFLHLEKKLAVYFALQEPFFFYNLQNFAKFIDLVDSSVLLGVVLSNAVL